MDIYDSLMGFKPEEIRVFLWKGNEGQAGELKVIHIPSGTVVKEQLHHESTDELIKTRDRLINQLKTEIGIE